MIVVVVAAHPDDEILGVGGTVARHAAEGDTVYPIIVAEGATSRGQTRGDVDQSEVSVLQRAAAGAAMALGVEPPRLLGLPDNRLDSMALLDVIKPIEALIDELKPEVVYTHHRGDLNVDHRIVSDAVRTASRPLPGSTVRAIYGFETVSSTEWGVAPFEPVRFVDVSAQMARKTAALDCYRSEMRNFPHARSTEAVEALARVRGASVALHACEAFTVIMEVVPSA